MHPEFKLTLVSIYYKYRTYSRFIWLRPDQKLTQEQLFLALKVEVPRGATYTPGG